MQTSSLSIYYNSINFRFLPSIGQVNPRLPRTFGDATIHVSHFDALVEGEKELPEHKPDVLTEVELSIGKLIAENLVENGATMQMGKFIFFFFFFPLQMFFHEFFVHLFA